MINMRFLTFALLALSASVSAATYISEGACEGRSAAERSTKIKLGADAFTIVDSNKDCDFSYIYYKSSMGDMVILVGPAEDQLGLNSQNEIFVAPAPDSIARSIGFIPVSANMDNDERFVNITQAGGSIFKAIYMIRERQLVVEPSSMELIFSGSQCIYPDGQSESCTNLMGSFKSPVCVRQIGGHKIRQKIELCADLKQKLQ